MLRCMTASSPIDLEVAGGAQHQRWLPGTGAERPLRAGHSDTPIVRATQPVLICRGPVVDDLGDPTRLMDRGARGRGRGSSEPGCLAYGRVGTWPVPVRYLEPALSFAR